MKYYRALAETRTVIRARHLQEYIEHYMSPDQLLEGKSTGARAPRIIALPDGTLRRSRQTTLLEFFKSCKQVVLREPCILKQIS